MNELNREQQEVLNIVQQVFDTVVMSLAALNPQAMPAFAFALRAGARDRAISPTASAMVDRLAAGVEVFAHSSPS